jgi:hypothetical protein
MAAASSNAFCCAGVSFFQAATDITSGQKSMNSELPMVANLACSDSRSDMKDS